MRREIISCSIDPRLLKRIDNLKHDVPRSRYIARLIEIGLIYAVPNNEKQEKKFIPADTSFEAKDQQVTELSE